MRFARRLDAVPPYLFAELERKVEDKRRAGVDVISLGIGDPDLPTPPAVVEELRRQAARSETHRYPSNRGLAPFRAAVSEFYAERFGVDLDPDGAVIPVLGGKEGVAHIALACLDPGDVCLATRGASDVGVEIFSLSKGWNMTGWRVGWIAGNPDVVERYRQLKTNIDSGMFDAIQLAGVAALRQARDFPAEMSEIYRRRRDLMIDALAAIGLPATPPRATPYIWARVPDGYTSATFTELVLDEAAVVVSPGPSFGPSGEGFVRVSLTIADERLEEAARRIASSLRLENSFPAAHPLTPGTGA